MTETPRLVVAFLMLASATGLVAAADDPKPEPKCISQSRISSFEAVDPSLMLILGPGDKEAFAAGLGAGCAGMDRRSTISFVDGNRNGLICGNGTDSVSFKDGPRVASCRITSMKRLSPEELEQFRVDHGLKKAPKDDAR